MLLPVNVILAADEITPGSLVVYEEKLWLVENVSYDRSTTNNTINLVDAVGAKSRIRWWDDYKPAVTRVLVYPKN